MTRRWVWVPVGAVTVSLVLPIATFLVACVLLGIRLLVVESGSMEPQYPVGSLMVVRPVDPSAVDVGMAIAFVPGDGRSLVTHRVVEVLHQANGLAFRTQGDANASPDPRLVPTRSVRGRAAWAVPHLGRPVRLLAWPRGFLLLVVVPGFVLAVAEWRDHRRAAATRDAATVS